MNLSRPAGSFSQVTLENNKIHLCCLNLKLELFPYQDHTDFITVFLARSTQRISGRQSKV